MSKEYKIHSVQYNFIMNVILKLSTVIFPFITFPYVSRILGAAGNGKIAFISSIISYFTLMAGLGIPTYGIRICAKHRDNKKELNKVVKELLIILAITTFIAYVTFFICYFSIPKFREDQALMLMYSMTILLTSFGVEWFYQAIEQYDYITFRNLAFKILSVILMFIFVKSNEDYLIYGFICILGGTGSNILNILRLRKYVDLKEKTDIDILIHIRPIVTLFMLSAASMIYTNLDSVMLGFITDNTEVGYYNAAVKLKNILLNFVTALGVVVLPRITNYLARKEHEEVNKLLKKSFNYVLISSLSLTIYCCFEARDCIMFLAGEGYEPAILGMQLISPSIIFIGFSNIIGLQILIPTERENYTLISTIIGAVVDVILNLILIPKYGSSGAALATTIAELFVLLYQIWIVRKEILNYLDLKNIVKIILSMIISTLTLMLVTKLIFTNVAFFNILISGITFFGSLLIVLIIFKEDTIYPFFMKFLNKIILTNDK